MPSSDPATAATAPWSIIDADGTQNTIDLGAPAVGVAVDSYGWAYVTGYVSAVDTTATLTVITPDGTVAEPIILGDEAWIGIAVDADDFLYGTDTSDNTANLISVIPVWDGPYDYTDVDAATGAVSGVVYVLDPGNHFTYALTTAPDSTLGSVSVDAATGDWVFTPTAQARLDAAESPDDIWVPFTITASYGQTSTVVDVEVWVEPAANDYDYDTSVIDSLGFGPASISSVREDTFSASRCAMRRIPTRARARSAPSTSSTATARSQTPSTWTQPHWVWPSARTAALRHRFPWPAPYPPTIPPT